jgi:hypothetical protein
MGERFMVGPERGVVRERDEATKRRPTAFALRWIRFTSIVEVSAHKTAASSEEHTCTLTLHLKIAQSPSLPRSSLYRYTCCLIVIAASRLSNAAGTNRHVRHMATPLRSPTTRPATAETTTSREKTSPMGFYNTLKQTWRL